MLLSHEGKSVPEITEHLNRNGHTIRRWLQRYMTKEYRVLKSRINPGPLRRRHQ
ncbi:helix-turn-helix domain-containing protein [Legionella antarctica]|uniref:helix-turn-helix domain-containing protein n=1 Tax=Legionella antarctica TaxID=2708020 RepID=UPI001D001A84